MSWCNNYHDVQVSTFFIPPWTLTQFITLCFDLAHSNQNKSWPPLDQASPPRCWAQGNSVPSMALNFRAKIPSDPTVTCRAYHTYHIWHICPVLCRSKSRAVIVWFFRAFIYAPAFYLLCFRYSPSLATWCSVPSKTSWVVKREQVGCLILLT